MTDMTRPRRARRLALAPPGHSAFDRARGPSDHCVVTGQWEVSGGERRYRIPITVRHGMRQKPSKPTPASGGYTPSNTPSLRAREHDSFKTSQRAQSTRQAIYRGTMAGATCAPI